MLLSLFAALHASATTAASHTSQLGPCDGQVCSDLAVPAAASVAVLLPSFTAASPAPPRSAARSALCQSSASVLPRSGAVDCSADERCVYEPPSDGGQSGAQLLPSAELAFQRVPPPHRPSSTAAGAVCVSADCFSSLPPSPSPFVQLPRFSAASAALCGVEEAVHSAAWGGSWQWSSVDGSLHSHQHVPPAWASHRQPPRAVRPLSSWADFHRGNSQRTIHSPATTGGPDQRKQQQQPAPPRKAASERTALTGAAGLFPFDTPAAPPAAGLLSAAPITGVSLSPAAPPSEAEAAGSEPSTGGPAVAAPYSVHANSGPSGPAQQPLTASTRATNSGEADNPAANAPVAASLAPSDLAETALLLEWEAQWRRTAQDSQPDVATKAADRRKQALPTQHATSDAADRAMGGEDAELDRLLAADEWLSGTSRGGSQGRSSAVSWAVTDRIDVTEFREMVPDPARMYPFELDAFQKEAIVHLERGDSVFVAAHTSAGKTVVAEYAIALAQRQLTRAVYTSPIKTLSNQKFREFRDIFGLSEVGLITGDVSIQPESPCLIMTAEILRSMLYKGADLIRDLAFVVFDEIHFINDLERGVVWEEILVLLPSWTQLILLSATAPNSVEFASWVGRIKRKKIHVITTDRRPVPLVHQIFVKGKLFTFCDQLGRFQAGVCRVAVEESTTDKRRALERRGVVRHSHSARAALSSLLSLLQQQALLPTVVFAFSKRVCEDSAYLLHHVDLTSHAEKSQILVFFNAAIKRLHSQDRALPQVLHVKEMSVRGISTHHAGMLPILKEVVEMLFGRGLIKVLFATETFAMGVNMPTRTVVFQSLRKHDGVEFRDLAPGEYTQMAGRAGRRGKDKEGNVIVLCADADKVPSETALKHITTGRPTRLQSRFRLTNNMILNLLRQEDMKVEDMMKRSFGEAKAQQSSAEMHRLLHQGESALAVLASSSPASGGVSGPAGGSLSLDCGVCDSSALTAYSSAYRELHSLHTAAVRALMRDGERWSAQQQALWQTGRVLLINKLPLPPHAALFIRSAAGDQPHAKASHSQFSALLLTPPSVTIDSLPAAWRQRSKDGDVESGEWNGRCYLILHSLQARDVAQLTPLVRDVDGAGVLVDRFPARIGQAVSALLAVEREYFAASSDSWRSLPSLDPFDALSGGGSGRANVLDGAALDLMLSSSRRAQLRQSLESNLVHSCPRRDAHVALLTRQSLLAERVDVLRACLDEGNLAGMAEYEARLELLQRLHFIDAGRSVLIKGRVACELNTCDSVIGTELVFDNSLGDMSAMEILATLSCLVFRERGVDPPPLSDRLHECLARLTAACERVARTSFECGVDVEVAAFVSEQVNPGLMEVVHAWAEQQSFVDICQLTNVLEGSIVRAITRLEETCKDIRSAARLIGDTQLYDKMTQASLLIKRDIVFAASLYVT